MNRIHKTILAIVSLTFFLVPGISCAESQISGERILSYHSEITVNQDSSINVTEDIKVKSKGINIKHGIYRDFPTKYTDKNGKTYQVGFDVLSVKKDEINENYKVESMSNGKRVYIGKSYVSLSPGEYTYTLQYKTTRQLGFFEDHDELYWNVTGNGWAFPIDETSARVTLPSGITSPNIKLDGYTGYQGSTKKNFKSKINDNNEIVFETTKSLSANEGLTLVVGWPKGFVTNSPVVDSPKEEVVDSPKELVTEPTQEKASSYSIIYLFLGTIITLIYFILAWVKIGKDPQKGTIVPLYYPPEGFSPAALRYINKMGFDTKTFATSIINMAVKGYLTIEDKSLGVFGGKTFSIVQASGDESVLSPEEAIIANNLLGGKDHFDFEQTHYSEIRSATSSLTTYLNKNYSKKYFSTNYGYFFIGLILSIAGYVGGLFNLGERTLFVAGFLSVWLSIWSIGVTFLITTVITNWKMVFSGSKSSLPTALFFSVFSLPFLIGEIVALSILALTCFSLGLSFIILFALNVLFWHLLKAPTLEGRAIMDKIEGFKMYLSYAEKDELNYATPVEMTPEIFEKYLPFALALEVENEWAEKFSSTLERTAEEQNYHPAWYAGDSWDVHNMSGFTSSIGDGFSSAISSSSTAPGSSSGFSSSGGSSGGGGGGGGGGGW